MDYKSIRKEMDIVLERLVDTKPGNPLTDHINKYPLPSSEMIISILWDILDIIFPGYYTTKEINDLNLKNFINSKINSIYEKLTVEIRKTIILGQQFENKCCEQCSDLCMNKNEDKAVQLTMMLINKLENIREMVAKDVLAAFAGDPAAGDYSEVILSYPSIFAVTVHRVAHILYQAGVRYIPRMMSEYSHMRTGIDIHPGATIGENFFIDHGTGVVIGETCEIGNNVKLYQGVTLGALSFPRDNQGAIIKGKKRHPKIEDNVTIYAGATILGGDTVIGAGSTIGGNCWIISSLPPNSRVSVDFSQWNSVSSRNKN